MLRRDMATSDMAVVAAERASTQAGVKPRDIDLVIVATFTPDWPVPADRLPVQTRWASMRRDGRAGRLRRLHLRAGHRHAVRRHRHAAGWRW